ncbi:unnamed protein product [Cuscuta epithymum]|uniref:BHLH domain-containing protein n=1 Tax=Cuscuta epithymum TaxID=186058 RepID=A0AAV0G842_9ASTE|nr:unnamed protein product [Cuscuta epithymum]CAH9143928.1 unnamed protein product [Cuscuta epithymum]
MSHHHHFTPDMQILKQPFSALSNDPAAMEIMNPFQDLINPIGYSAELPSLNYQSSMGFCPESFLPPEFAANLCQNFPADGHHPLLQSEMKTKKKAAPRAANRPSMNSKITDHTPEISSLTHSESATKSTNSGGRRKRKKNGEEEEEVQVVEEEEEKQQQREVVHVRAKRGQATDSHSLAERVRREKINERLRCLQEIVPGCYKTMGMAVMLDEIINYVQSLQNQVEFLSLKLAAASTYYDFNSERDHTGTMQRAKAYEGLKMERLHGSEGVANSNPLDHSSGGSPYPSVPHSS